jgi:nitroimidazol reductase NimA-like FMN-containing flavoprotein (pyridoxamine 5'-phosphate oxidase superfamily)
VPGAQQPARRTPEEQAAFLQEGHKAALATLDKDGFPHVVAMGFLAKDGSNLTNAQTVTLSDGKKVFAGSSADGNNP